MKIQVLLQSDKNNGYMNTFGARQATDDNIIGCRHFACWITEAADTLLEYVMLNGNNGFANTPLCYIYTYIACLVLHIKQLFTYIL